MRKECPPGLCYATAIGMGVSSGSPSHDPSNHLPHGCLHGQFYGASDAKMRPPELHRLLF